MAKKMGEYMMSWLQSIDFAILDWIAENLRCDILDSFFPHSPFWEIAAGFLYSQR